jgi:SAM-dependent methyltransferase
MPNLTKYRLMETLDKMHLLESGYRLSPYILAANPYSIASNFPYWLKGAPDGSPIPPLSLVYKVTSSSSIAWFLRGGELAVQSMSHTLERNGFSFKNFTTILDFGCGCCRVVRHLKALTKAELHGTDYNPDLISWCSRHLDFARFATNQSGPPLNYTDKYFDFVYAISVFTHLPEDLQIAWVKELSRILKPNGLLLITTHGAHYVSRLTPGEQGLFQLGHLIVKRTKHLGTNLCTAFHPEQHVRNNLLKGFKVIDFVPAGMKGAPHQDIYLAKKS